jgi:serine/threonine protein phosphatase PrpC
MKCAIAQETHIGRRPSNQDRLGHWRTPESILLVAADGMGGHAHGEFAAALALRYLAAAFRLETTPLAAPGAFLRKAALGAHAALLRDARARGLPDTPRTTVVACVVQQGWAWWAHVGDSRLYLVRHGAIAARTVDHTLVQQWVDEGALEPSQARRHPQRNRLLQCLGGVRTPHLGAVTAARLERDDVLLLCTDGFWEPLHDRQIVAGLESGTLAEGLARLAGLARERAGADSDNLSALALAWHDAAVPLVAGAAPGPRPEPVDDTARIDTPDPDILRAMDEDR